MKDDWPIYTKEKLVPPHSLKAWGDEIRSRHKTIVTLNGSFDLLHSGHLHILHEASKCGDVLIVALNSDESIKRYKSKNRPFITLSERLKMVSAISFVDYVTWFEEDDPRELLRKIRPNVHVNGADWGEDCIERSVVEEVGGRLQIVKLVPGLSTTAIVERINAAHSHV